MFSLFGWNLILVYSCERCRYKWKLRSWSIEGIQGQRWPHEWPEGKWEWRDKDLPINVCILGTQWADYSKVQWEKRWNTDSVKYELGGFQCGNESCFYESLYLYTVSFLSIGSCHLVKSTSKNYYYGGFFWTKLKQVGHKCSGDAWKRTWLSSNVVSRTIFGVFRVSNREISMCLEHCWCSL